MSNDFLMKGGDTILMEGEIIYANVNPEEEKGYFWLDFHVLDKSGRINAFETGYRTLSEAVDVMNSLRSVSL